MGVLAGIAMLAQVITPVLINLLLRFMQDTEGDTWPEWSGYVLAAGFLVTLILRSMADNHYQFLGNRLALQVRTAISTLVYNKSVRISSGTNIQTGELVNLMQLDAQKLCDVVPQLHFLWTAPAQLLILVAQLIVYIGPSALGGLASLPIFTFVQGMVMMKLFSLRKVVMKASDERIKLTNEILQGIRVIKMYAWEEYFQERLNKLRDMFELKGLLIASIYKGLSFGLVSTSTIFVIIITLIFYTLAAKKDLSAAQAFTVINVFDQLRIPLMILPQTVNMWSECKVSLNRLSDFMTFREAPMYREEAEKKKRKQASTGETLASISEVEMSSLDGVEDEEKKQVHARDRRAASMVDPNVAVSLRNCDFWWSASVPALKDVNLTVPKGSLVAIIGPVGSGKTAMSLSLLNELERTRGDRVVRGSMAYVPQVPWTLNASLRENVLFGNVLNEERYQDVLKACALSRDLELLPDGDATEIGERGINLSGGQKQRVSIARAVYYNSDVYVFDDPLSALDPDVARQVFENCVVDLLKSKTRIMVTNQLHFVSKADLVVVLGRDEECGRIVEMGTYADLMSRGLNFANLMAKVQKDAQVKKEEGEEGAAPSPSPPPTNGVAEEKKQGHGLLGAQSSRGLLTNGDPSNGKKRDKALQLVTQEERATGAVPPRLYFGCIRTAKAPVLLFFTIVCFVASFASIVGGSLWLAYWVDEIDKGNGTPDKGHGYYVGISVAIAFAQFATTFGRSSMTYTIAARASKNLHRNLLRTIMSAPTFFFDTTPVGRILARFSKDLDQIDNMLPMTMAFFIFSALLCIVSLLVSISITPYVGLVVIVLFPCYLWVLSGYRSTSREVKRMDSNTRSPVYAHFGNSLIGLTSIRAYGLQERFVQENEVKIDRNSRASVILRYGERWLTMRLDAMGYVLVFAAAVFAVARRGNLFAGLAGVSLNYSMAVTNMLGWTVRNMADMENQMNSVERVLYYTETAPQEKAAVIDGHRPPEHWPPNGEIEVDHLTMRYRPELELVLKGVTVTIRPKQKVGVVGRTGSGKSSFLLSL